MSEVRILFLQFCFLLGLYNVPIPSTYIYIPMYIQKYRQMINFNNCNKYIINVEIL